MCVCCIFGGSFFWLLWFRVKLVLVVMGMVEICFCFLGCVCYVDL